MKSSIIDLIIYHPQQENHPQRENVSNNSCKYILNPPWHIIPDIKQIIKDLGKKLFLWSVVEYQREVNGNQ